MSGEAAEQFGRLIRCSKCKDDSWPWLNFCIGSKQKLQTNLTDHLATLSEPKNYFLQSSVLQTPVWLVKATRNSHNKKQPRWLQSILVHSELVLAAEPKVLRSLESRYRAFKIPATQPLPMYSNEPEDGGNLAKQMPPGRS